MGPAAGIALINLCIETARNIYETVKSFNGGDSLPSWDEIISNNKVLQEKIDSERQKSGGGQ